MIVKNEKLKNAVLSALADREMKSILDCTIFKSKSMNEVLKETSIPQTSTFRKIKWLLDKGLLIVDSIMITNEGKRSSLFKNVLRSAIIRYEYGNLVVEILQNVDPTEKIAEKLFSLNSN